MTTLREAAQQALEALEQDNPAGRTATITALRAALAEHYCDTHCTWADHVEGCVRAEPVQEPVAWLIDYENGEREVRFVAGTRGIRQTPLYTAPPQRKPLTEEDIWRTYKNLWMFHPAEEPRLAGDVLKFARAIERAHGIGDNT